jgi:hypothetical protein
MCLSRLSKKIIGGGYFKWNAAKIGETIARERHKVQGGITRFPIVLVPITPRLKKLPTLRHV